MVTKPLTIWVDQKWITHPRIIQLAEKGHSVKAIQFDETIDAADLILSERAWKWHDGMWDFIDMAIKQARELTYGYQTGIVRTVGNKEGIKPVKSKKTRKKRTVGTPTSDGAVDRMETV